MSCLQVPVVHMQMHNVVSSCYQKRGEEIEKKTPKEKQRLSHLADGAPSVKETKG